MNKFVLSRKKVERKYLNKVKKLAKGPKKFGAKIIDFPSTNKSRQKKNSVIHRLEPRQTLRTLI